MISGTNTEKMAKWADITSLIVTLFILLTFLTYFQTRANMDSPLIPEWTTEYVMKPWMVKGVLLSFGLMTGLFLRLARLVRGQLLVNIALIILALVYSYAYSFIMA